MLKSLFPLSFKTYPGQPRNLTRPLVTSANLFLLEIVEAVS